MRSNKIRLLTLVGDEIAHQLQTLAELRTVVFREWPYLYEGDETYEQEYLKHYLADRRAMVVLAVDSEKVVGASTCMPMMSAALEVRAPLEAPNLDPEKYFYFGESVLHKAYRGTGIGVKFFAAREAHAAADGNCDYALFYAVRRAAEHPSRPVDFKPLDNFWRNRGFRPAPEIVCKMSWNEIGRSSETTHVLDAWCKSLENAL